MKKILLIAFLAIILVTPVLAHDYGKNDYGSGDYGTGEDISVATGAGGAGGPTQPPVVEEVSQDNETIEEDLRDTTEEKSFLSLFKTTPGYIAIAILAIIAVAYLVKKGQRL